MRVLALLVALWPLAGCSQGAVEDGEGDKFAVDGGKTDDGQSSEGAGVLELVNVAAASLLTDEVGLSDRVSLDITSHRAGSDGVLDTADDDPFGDLAELDAVPHVGDGVYAALLAYATDHRYVHDEAATLSASKLGPHVMGNAMDPAALELVDACPRVAKWVLPTEGAKQAISRYRARCPGGAVVVRVFVPRSVSYQVTDDAASAAADFWTRVQDGLSGLSPADIDWLEGPNELDNLPNWCTSTDASAWFAQFWSSLADRMNAAGYWPLVGSIAPRCAAHGPLTMSEAFMPTATVMKTKAYPWGWSYHAYSDTQSQDVATETFALGYRAVRNDCGLRGVPIVLSEGGALTFTASGVLGWKAGTGAGLPYLDWLRWFDARMNEDPAVVGMALYQLGNHGVWDSYDVSPIAARLARYLRGL